MSFCSHGNRSSNLTVFKRFAMYVGTVHVALVLWMIADHILSSSSRIHRPLVVRTSHPVVQVSAAPREITPARPRVASPAKQQKAKSMAVPKKKNSPPVPQKIAKKSIRKEQMVEEPAPQNVEESTPVLQPLRKLLPEIKLPALLESQSASALMEQSSVPTEGASRYSSCLIETFQSELQLPETGEVRVKIALRAPGQIISLEILEAKSSKNAEWLKNRLPLLALPCFNEFGVSDAELEFTVLFRNVENT